MAMDSRKRRVLYLCLFTYTVSYICRTNLSIAIDPMMEDLCLTGFQVSMVNTLYFWFYGMGQVLGGFAATRHDPRHVLVVGLLLTGSLNIIVSLMDSIWAVSVLWALNGLALALFWPSIMQICSKNFTDDEFASIAMLLNLPTTLGYFLSWFSFAHLSASGHWRIIFLIPGLIAYASTFVWSAGNDKMSKGMILKDIPEGRIPTEYPPIGSILLRRSMIAFALILLLEGAARESMNTWAPLLVRQSMPVKDEMLSFFLSAIPLVNTAGMLLTHHIIRNMKSCQDSIAVCVMVCLSFLLAVLLDVCRGYFIVFILLYSIELSALCIGASFVVTLVPLRAAESGQCALVSGIFNLICYIGASLGMLLSGYVSTRFGWNAIYGLWIALAFAACLMLPAIFERKHEWTYT